jgi:hypothetical protein
MLSLFVCELPANLIASYKMIEDMAALQNALVRIFEDCSPLPAIWIAFEMACHDSRLQRV